MSDEPEFVDHRPEVEGEEPDDASSSDVQDDGGELLFAESAGEALAPSQRPTGRQRRPPPPKTATGRHARLGSGGQRRPSGRLRRPPPQSGRHARVSSGAHPRAPSGAHPRARGRQSSGAHPAAGSGPHRRKSSGAHPVASRSGAHRRPRPAPHKPGSASEIRDALPDRQAQAVASMRAQIKPAPEGDPYVNRELGPFKVEAFLGMDRGERRYVGLHTESKEEVLLRLFPLKGSYAGEFAKLAARGERACRVQHPQLAGALGAGKANDCFFVGGPPPIGQRLSTLLAEGEPLDPDALKTLLADIGGALGALHQRQLVHANVSPESIRLLDGRWFLHEAGLSRPRAEFDFLSAGGEVLGDPGYIAPETVDSGEQTSASDLYALGCVAWAALSLRPPFTGDDPVQVLLDQLNVDVPEVEGVPGKEVPEELKVIVGKLCGYTPEVRYGASRELLSDLKGLERGEVPKAFSSDLKQDDDERAAESLGSGRAVVIVLAGFNVLALGALFFVWLQYSGVVYDDPLESFGFPEVTSLPAVPPSKQ